MAGMLGGAKKIIGFVIAMVVVSILGGLSYLTPYSTEIGNSLAIMASFLAVVAIFVALSFVGGK